MNSLLDGMKSHICRPAASYGQGEKKSGVNYGDGLKITVTGPWQVRFDYRQFNTGKPFGLRGTGQMLLNEISAGVSWTM